MKVDVDELRSIGYPLPRKEAEIINAAADEIEALRGLLPYSRHHLNCPRSAMNMQTGDCYCGLDEARALLKGTPDNGQG